MSLDRQTGVGYRGGMGKKEGEQRQAEVKQAKEFWGRAFQAAVDRGNGYMVARTFADEITKVVFPTVELSEVRK